MTRKITPKKRPKKSKKRKGGIQLAPLVLDLHKVNWIWVRTHQLEKLLEGESDPGNQHRWLKAAALARKEWDDRGGSTE